MNNIYTINYKSEIGLIEITGNEEGILTLDFIDKNGNKKYKPDFNSGKLPPLLKECLKQLDEYFKGERIKFKLPLILDGTEFQKKVWNQLSKIPFGKTNSYKDIAVKIGNNKASRAVGNANNKNKIPLIIPCHRVIGSDKKPVGYAKGVWRKEWLIEHESKTTQKN